MSQFHYAVDLAANGRMIIPAEVCSEIGIERPSKLVMTVDGNSITLKTARQHAEDVRERLKKSLTNPLSVDDFLAQRQAEALAESRPDAA